MSVTQINLIEVKYNRGAFVTWGDGRRDEKGQMEAITRHGIIECPMTHKPEWYYVRNEHGDLDCVHWAELTLADRGLHWTNKDGKVVPLRT
jgi:hypothetical protein